LLAQAGLAVLEELVLVQEVVEAQMVLPEEPVAERDSVQAAWQVPCLERKRSERSALA